MSPKKEELILRTPSPLNTPSGDPTTPPKPPKPPISERIKTIRLPGSLNISSFNERLNSTLSQYQSTKQKQISSSNSISDSSLSLKTTTSQTKYIYYNNDNDNDSDSSTTENNVEEESNNSYTDQYIFNQYPINLNIFAETDNSSTSSHSSKQSCNISTHNASVVTSHSPRLHDQFISPSPLPSPSSSSSKSLPSPIKITNDIIPETSVKYNISSSTKSSPERPLRSNNHRPRIKMESVQKSHKIRLSPSYRSKGKLIITHRFNRINSTSSVGSTDTSEDESESVLEERKSWINRLRPRSYNKITQDNNSKVNPSRTTTYGYRYNKPSTRKNKSNNINKNKSSINKNNNGSNKNNGIKETKPTEKYCRQQSISRSPSLKPITRSSSSSSPSSPSSTTTSLKMDSTSVLIRRSTRKLKPQNLPKK